MKPYTWIAAAALMLCTPAAYASSNYAYCEPCYDFDSCFDLHLNIYADYLYWNVNRGNLVACDKSLCPDYDSDFRVGIQLPTECLDFGVRYTHFRTVKSKPGAPEPLKVGESDQVKIQKYLTQLEAYEHNRRKYGIEMNVVDFEVGSVLSLSCSQVNLRPFAGAKLAWINEKFDGWKNDYKAVGIYMGTEAEWYLLNMCNTAISLVTRGAFGGLDGVFNTEFNYNKKECLFNTYYEVMAGLNFNFGDLCGFNPNLMIGYEAQNYGSWRDFSTANGTSSLGLGGLVVRAGLAF